MARKTKAEAEKTRAEIIEAARRVFHSNGVSHSTLEKIAQEAGVTRGAVYWHFANKTELFFAMREDVFLPLRERADALLFSTDYANPLDAIAASLCEFFRVLAEDPTVCMVFEIMISRCEYVGEFVAVKDEVGRPAQDFLAKIEQVYRLAADKGYLRAGLDPVVIARDTWAFTSGVLHLLFGCQQGSDLRFQIDRLIADHMALRRRDPA